MTAVAGEANAVSGRVLQLPNELIARLNRAEQLRLADF